MWSVQLWTILQNCELCACSIGIREEGHNIRYELFAVARPDNMYKSEFPSSCLLDADGRVLPDAFSVDHEVWFAPFSSVEKTFASLDDPERLECCNMTSRTPKGCFWAGLAEPDATFMYIRHLQRNGLKLASKRAGCHWTNEIRRNGSVHLMREHGKYRPRHTPRDARRCEPGQPDLLAREWSESAAGGGCHTKQDACDNSDARVVCQVACTYERELCSDQIRQDFAFNASAPASPPP